MGANLEAAKSKKPPAHALLRGYLEHLTNERRLSPHTLENYARDIATLIDLSGDTSLKQMQVHHVRRHVAQLHSRGLNGRTLARMLSAWRGFFRPLTGGDWMCGSEFISFLSIRSMTGRYWHSGLIYS